MRRIFRTGTDKATKRDQYNELTLFQVLEAEKLLAGKKYQNLLKKLPKLIGIQEEYYQTIYMKLIENFVEHVQALPFANGHGICSLMNRGLARAYYTVEAYQELNPEHMNHLHTYVLFSAMLLRDIGRVACGRQVLICNDQGEFLRAWHPFENSMIYQGEYYRIRHTSEEYPELYRSFTPILAEKIMPIEGFLWISENEASLHLWFQLLQDDPDELPSYQDAAEVAQKHANSYFSGPEFLLPVEVRQAREMNAGQNFYEWIKENLSNGNLSVGQEDSLAHEVEEGLFIEVDELYEKYAKEKKVKGKDGLKQFEKLGVSKEPKEGGRDSYKQKLKSGAGKLAGGGVLSKKGAGGSYQAAKGRSSQKTAVKGLVLKGDKKTLGYEIGATKVIMTPGVVEHKEIPIGLIMKNIKASTSIKPPIDGAGRG